MPSTELKKVPANTRIRLKLIHYLLKSRQAAVTFPACIQVSRSILQILESRNFHKNSFLTIGYL